MKAQVARAAQMMRWRARLLAPSFSIHELVAANYPTALVTGRDLPDGIHEIVTVTDAGPIILYRRGLSTCDQRIAIAHALGHLAFDFDTAGRRIATLADPAVEDRADAFAIELLAPLELVAAVAPERRARPDILDREEFRDRLDGIATRFHVPVWTVERQMLRISA